MESEASKQLWLLSLFGTPEKKAYDMKTNTYHSMHQTDKYQHYPRYCKQKFKEEFTRIYASGRNLHLFIGCQPIIRKLSINCKNRSSKNGFLLLLIFFSTCNWQNTCLLTEFDNKNSL